MRIMGLPSEFKGLSAEKVERIAEKVERIKQRVQDKALGWAWRPDGGTAPKQPNRKQRMAARSKRK